MRFISLRDLSKVAVTPVQEASYCQDADFRIIYRNSFKPNKQTESRSSVDLNHQVIFKMSPDDSQAFPNIQASHKFIFT